MNPDDLIAVARTYVTELMAGRCSIRVELELMTNGRFCSLLVWSIDSSIPKRIKADNSDLEVVLRSIRNTVCQVLRHAKCSKGEIDFYSYSVSNKLRIEIIKDGAIENPRKKVGDLNYDFVVREFLKKELPPTIGGLRLSEIRHYERAANMIYCWSVWWGEPDEDISIEIEIPKMTSMDVRTLEHKVKREFQEQVALLKMRNPGEYEVECIEATGVDNRLNEGLTYMAATHSDKNLIFVWDRYGKRGEFGMFRFREIKMVTVKIDKVREGASNFKLDAAFTNREGVVM